MPSKSGSQHRAVGLLLFLGEKTNTYLRADAKNIHPLNSYARMNEERNNVIKLDAECSTENEREKWERRET